MERVCYMHKRKPHELILDCLTWNYLNKASILKLYLEGLCFV